ncbi:unnamed protein product [Tilletia laevis]|uniref:Amino acid transporter transmembrane domain-containing protein n=2 Tax=Tilletia TaxID=13289 RepID=A0A177TDP0_9BASI|nr:hypothetical protein CF336_g8128 [Tilletia laevis]KAE8243489.1 hypothetical protein A4X03_0g7751 [Tilletia caries]KAE8185321.1 hypothetical protein CF335_g7755 [Tilletia laevis]CAD6884978.1 unnamed protein product [Tilletia caries]CAD6906717.1 unnamed protein product [Tilletia caries]
MSDQDAAAAAAAGQQPAHQRRQPRKSANASVFSSIANLTNTQIGAAMLSLPHAIASTGLLFGLALVVLCACTSALGLYLLTRCADKLGGRRTSFFEIASRTVPGGAKWFDGAIALKCFGVSIGYLIICGQLMPQVVISFTKALHHDIHSIPDFLLERSTWILLLMIFLLPFCFLRRLDSLRHTSYLSLLAVLYLVVIVLTYALAPSMRATLPPRKGEIHLITFDSHLISIFPVYVFAFTCAQNVFPVFNELKRNTEKRVNRVIVSSVGTAGLVYMVVGGFGYATFGSAVADNIITMYPSTNLFVCFGRLSIVTLTLFSYPLQIHPCRASLDKVLFSRSSDEGLTLAEAEEEAEADARTPLTRGTTASTGDDVDDDNDVVIAPSSSSSTYRDEDEEGGTQHTAVSEDARARRSARLAEAREKGGEIPLGRWCILTASLLSSTFIVSMLVDDLGLVLGIVGSVGSTTISFILPGILFAMMHKDEPGSNTRLYAKLLAAWGIIVMVVSLSANIVKIVHGPSNPGAGAVLASLAANGTAAVLGVAGSKADKLASLGVVLPLATATATVSRAAAAVLPSAIAGAALFL